jgi:hypothetical protein
MLVDEFEHVCLELIDQRLWNLLSLSKDGIYNRLHQST